MESGPGAEAPAGWVGRRALSETALINLALLVLGAVTGIITARVLGPENRGALALALSVAGISSVVAGLGLMQALAYRVAAHRDELVDALSLSLWAGALAGFLVAGIGWVLAGLLIEQGSFVDAVRLALLSVPVTAVGGNISGVLQGLRLARPFNLLRLAPPAGFALLLVIAVVAGARLSPVEIVLMYLAACTAATAVSILFVRGSLQPRRAPSWLFSRATLRYGLIVSIGSLAWTANRQLGLIVLAALTTFTNVGLYSVALGYASPVGVAAFALALHTLPDVAAEPDQAAQVRVARRRLKMTLITTLPLAAGGVLAAPLLVPLAFGDDFSGAVVAAQVLVVGQALLGLNHVLSEVSRGLERPGLPAVTEGIGATATILILPVVVPAFGLVGAAVSSTAIYAATGLILYLGLREQMSG